MEGGGVAVGGMAMFELGVESLVNCVMKVASGSLEETLANVPACLHVFPLFFLVFAHMGGSGAINGRVVAAQFSLFNVCGDAGLIVYSLTPNILARSPYSLPWLKALVSVAHAVDGIVEVGLSLCS